MPRRCNERPTPHRNDKNWPRPFNTGHREPHTYALTRSRGANLEPRAAQSATLHINRSIVFRGLSFTQGPVNAGLPLASNSLMWLRKPPLRRPTRWSPRLRATCGGDSERSYEGDRQWASGGHRHCHWHKTPSQVAAQDVTNASGRAGRLEEERRSHTLVDELVSRHLCHAHSHTRGVNVKCQKLAHAGRAKAETERGAADDRKIEGGASGMAKTLKQVAPVYECHTDKPRGGLSVGSDCCDQSATPCSSPLSSSQCFSFIRRRRPLFSVNILI